MEDPVAQLYEEIERAEQNDAQEKHFQYVEQYAVPFFAVDFDGFEFRPIVDGHRSFRFGAEFLV